jgi:hypothetical protein
MWSNQSNVASIRRRATIAAFIFLLPPVITRALQISIDTTRVPVGVSDLIVVQRANGAWLYLADEKSGAVYRAQFDPKDPRPIEFTEFKEYFSDFAKPTALANWNERLIVCDSEANGLYEINLDTGEKKRLLENENLGKPKSIAISAKGVIAVGSDKIDGVIWYKAGTLKKMNYAIDDPVRAVFVGDELQVLDKETKNIYRIKSDVFKDSAPHTLQQSVEVPPGVKTEDSQLYDFAFDRGCYYLADKRRVSTFLRGRSNEIPPWHISTSEGEGRRLAISEYYLLLADQKTGKVIKLPRPIPINVSFELDPNASTEELISGHRAAQANLLQYLKKNDLLGLTPFTPSRSYESIKDLFVDQNILMPDRIDDKPGQNPSINLNKAKANAELEDLGCQLGYWNCEQSRNRAEPPVIRTIPAGKEILLPTIILKSDLAKSRLSLGPKSVEEYLLERLSSEHLKVVDGAYLWRNNSDLQKSIEGILGRTRFIKADPPSANIPVGTIIRFEKGRDIYQGDLFKCGNTLSESIRSSPYHIPSPLRLAAVAENLPQDRDSSPVHGKTPKLNVDQMEVQFSGLATVQKINAEKLKQIISEPGTASCLGSLMSPGNYVIVEAIKVLGAKYTFKRSGLTAKLRKEDIERWNIPGRVTDSGDGALVIDTPFYIGYRILPLAPTDLKQWKLIADSTFVKPKNSQDIFSMTYNVVDLPYTRWHLNTYVWAADLNDPKPSNLFNSVKAYRGVYIIPELEIMAKETSQGIDNPPLILKSDCLQQGCQCQEDQNRECPFKHVCERHKKMKDLIKYLYIPGLQVVRVGLAEQRAPDYDHPAFMDESGDSVWEEILPDGSLEPRAGKVLEGCSNEASNSKNGNSPVVRTLTGEEMKIEHPTHVAGLIAGNANSIAPGLAPFARLVLIPISPNSVSEFYSFISKAKAQNINLFSISQSIDEDDSLSTLKRQMMSNPGPDLPPGAFTNLLFIVAAGDEKADFNNTEGKVSGKSRMFVGWKTVKNVLVVGATDDTDNIWEESFPAILGKQGGSNYGKSWVHLLAPGVDIFSTASGNSYAKLRGTSQAVPLVTSAAAMLEAQAVTGANTIKARLIYTTDWEQTKFIGKVWGGKLNFKRAVWKPHQGYFITIDKEAENTAKVIEIKKSTFIHTIRETGRVYDQENDLSAKVPEKILFSQILRIQRQPDGRFRVIYMDGDANKLKILLDVGLEGNIEIKSMEIWDIDSNKKLKEVDLLKEDNEELRRISVTRFRDYVAKSPTSVNF